jgi:hypothetical protein
MSRQNIPDFPREIVRKPPSAPKFLITKKGIGDGSQNTTHEVVQVSGSAPSIRPQGLSNQPVISKLANRSQEREYTAPAHNYPPRDESEPKKGAANSKYDVKSSRTKYSESKLDLLPQDPSVPKPFVPLSTAMFAGGPQLHVRTANGTILGTKTKRFVDAKHVPNAPAEKPIGPECPYKDLNDEWTACWDDEAGAVYYYNKLSGEATWISPCIS